MIQAPWFWREHTFAARVIRAALLPFAAVYDVAQQTRRRFAKQKSIPIPIICIGNATLGGVGKTPFAIALAALLEDGDAVTHFLTRGYGGTLSGPIKVDPTTHGAREVGDEPLLLARRGPVWVSKDRTDGAKAAAHSGATQIIMDDGFQNPTIEKTVSILLVDAADSGSNGLIFPAGPLREPLARARARANIVVYVGADRKTAVRAAEKNATPYAAWLEPVCAPAPTRVTAFSGIGKPAKFFASLTAHGFEIAEAISFPDHHQFSDRDLKTLREISAKKRAPLITTEKDYVRLPEDCRPDILRFPVEMKINHPVPLIAEIRAAIDRQARSA